MPVKAELRPDRERVSICLRAEGYDLSAQGVSELIDQLCKIREQMELERQ